MKEIKNKQLIETTNKFDFKLIFMHGILLTIIISVIFIIAKILGLEQIIWLRFINYIVYFPVAYMAINKVYKKNEKLDYFSGLTVGFLTCIFGQLMYAIIFFIYLHFDKPLMLFINSQFYNRLFYPELSISFLLFSEGLAWSAITAFAWMQVFKWKRGRWAVH